jgi:hypothetical protein
LTKNTIQTELRQSAQRSETSSASRLGEEAEMARNVEKLIKMERPREVSEMKLDTIEVFPTIPKLDLDLMDIEPYTGPGITCHIELGLDQLEEQEE